MPTVYVSDLDGTLFHPDAHFSDRSRVALRDLLARDVLFTVASARSFVSMRNLLDGVPLKLPVVGFNGGTVVDWSTGRRLHRAILGSSIARQLVAVAQDEGLRPFVSTSGEVDRLAYTESVNGGMDWYLEDRVAAKDPRLQQVESLDGVLEEDVLCITLIGDRELLRRLHADALAEVGSGVRPQYYPNSYGDGAWDWLTFHGPDATKARGIDVALEIAGLSDARVVVFGDALNDLEMFERADYAIATANAKPAVLDAADEIIGPNTDDSVVAWLEANA